MGSIKSHSIGSKQAAYTVVELLTVTVILSIAALIAAPLVAESEQTRLLSAARLLMADLAFAQSETIAHPDDAYGVKFDHATETYSVVHDVGAPPFDCGAATVVTDPVTNQVYSTLLGGSGRGSQLAGVTIENSLSLNGDDCIVFGEFGQTDQATAASVTLAAGGATLAIQIDPISGEATIP